MTTVLGEHIDKPDDRHRLTLLSEKALRCHDCSRTLVLPSTSGSSNPLPRRDPKPDEQCPRHLGEFEHTCRCCAAEQLEHERTSAVGTGSPPTEEYLAAKAALRARNYRTPSPTTGHASAPASDGMSRRNDALANEESTR